MVTLFVDAEPDNPTQSKALQAIIKDFQNAVQKYISAMKERIDVMKLKRYRDKALRQNGDALKTIATSVVKELSKNITTQKSQVK